MHDFLRGITPVIQDLLEIILKKETGITIDKVCRPTTQKQYII